MIIIINFCSMFVFYKMCIIKTNILNIVLCKISIIRYKFIIQILIVVQFDAYSFNQSFNTRYKKFKKYCLFISLLLLTLIYPSYISLIYGHSILEFLSSLKPYFKHFSELSFTFSKILNRL